MDDLRAATFLSAHLPGLEPAAEDNQFGNRKHADVASFEYVFCEKRWDLQQHVLSQYQSQQHYPPSLEDPSRGLQSGVSGLLSRLSEAAHDAVRPLHNAAVKAEAERGYQADEALPPQASTLPTFNFASITAAAASLQKRLSRGTGSHRRDRRKAKIRDPECQNSHRRRRTSCSDTNCSCGSHIAPVSTASVTTASSQVDERVVHSKTVKRPSWEQLLAHPLACLSLIPKDTSLFVAGALAGASAKTVTAPLDRLKLFLQVQDVNRKAGVAALTLPQAVAKIFKEEGFLGFWKGNVPQVVRILPYSAVQLFSYEVFKQFFQGERKELSIPGRLAAGACAGMTSTLITFPLDTLRFKMAVEPDMRTMSQAAVTLLRSDGVAGFYRGLGPSLLGIAPYIAINFCAYDLVRKAFPEKQQKSPQVTFATAVFAATLATVTCYPLDTIRRQMQVRGCQYTSMFDAFPVIIRKHGVAGLYRGFVINALKNLPTSSIRLTTYQSAKNLIARSNEEWDRLVAVRGKAR